MQDPISKSVGGNAPVLIDIFRQCVKPGKKIYIDPEIPPEKMANAKKAFVPVQENEHILCLIDTSVFGSAKQGLAITDRGLYWNDLAAPRGYRPYPEIGEVRVNQAITHRGLELSGGINVPLGGFELNILKDLACFLNRARQLYGVKGAAIRVISKSVLDKFEPLEISIKSMTISPQNRRFAYVKPVGFLLRSRALYVDGHKIGGEYDDIRGIVFSPDERHLAFAARIGMECFVTLDNKEGRRYDDLGWDHIAFSLDGIHLGYSAQEGKTWVMVVDGEAGQPYSGIYGGLPIFSPDGRRVAYGAKRGDHCFFVVDGMEGSSYDGLIKDSELFSPDSQRIAYGASKQGKCLVSVDGREGKLFDAVQRIRFSPDSKHVAYEAREGKDNFLVLDDKIEGKCYRGGLGADPPVFSPDGKHLAHVAEENNKWFVVLDRNEQERYELVGDLTFSPDSAHLAYFAKRGGEIIIVVDGIQRGVLDEIGLGSIAFSPDSLHFVLAGVRKKSGIHRIKKVQFVIVDGVKSEEYRIIFQKVVFDAVDRYHYLGLDQQDQIVFVEEKIE